MDSFLIVFVQLLTLACKLAAKDNLELLLLHNNNIDFEFEEREDKTGGAGRAAYLINKYKQEAAIGERPPVLYLNAGDNFAKTRSLSSHEWEMVADYLNMLKPDVMCLGNHDLNIGVVNLTQFLKRLEIPVVGVNVDMGNNIELKKYIKQSHILQVKDHKIGIIGYTTSKTRIPFLPRSMQIRDEIESVQRECSRLHHMGVKIIIALGHSGYDTDRTIVRLVEHIDVIIAAHRSGSVDNVPFQNVVKREDRRYVPIIHEPGSLTTLGMVKIKFDVNGDVTSFRSNPVKLHSKVPQAPGALVLQERYKRSGDIYETLGKSLVSLSNKCSNRECNFANLITDAMCDWRTKIYRSQNHSSLWTDCPIGIINSGMVRRAIETKGSLTRSDFMRAIYYQNTAVLVQISGDHIRHALEQGLRLYGPRNSGLLQFAGIHAVINMSRSPGNRIIRCFVRCGQCSVPKYKELDINREYKVIVNDYLYNGIYNVDSIKNGAVTNSPKNFEIGKMVTDYIKIYKTIFPEEDDRFIVTDVGAIFLGNGYYIVLIFIILRYVYNI